MSSLFLVIEFLFHDGAYNLFEYNDNFRILYKNNVIALTLWDSAEDGNIHIYFKL